MVGASVSALVTSCDGGDDGTDPTDPQGGNGTGLTNGGGNGGDVGGAGAESNGGGEGGAPSPVWLGVTANGATDTASSAVEAQLTVLAAGARGAVLSRRWSDLDEDELTLAATLHADHDVRLLVELAVVDRAFDARPEGLDAVPWDDPSVEAAALASIDTMVAAAGDTLLAVSLGRDVDVYLERNPAEQVALVALLTAAVDHTRSSVGPEVHVGVGLTSGVLDDPSAAVDELVALGDAAILSHRPGFELGEDPSSQPPIASALDAMMDRFPTRPVLLSAVSFPTDGEVSSTEEEQRAFYEGFFAALEPRRAAFPLVNLERLNDVHESACESWAIDQGETLQSTVAAYRCSTGLWAEGGVPKTAWPEVLAGMARFASP